MPDIENKVESFEQVWEQRLTPKAPDGETRSYSKSDISKIVAGAAFVLSPVGLAFLAEDPNLKLVGAVGVMSIMVGCLSLAIIDSIKDGDK